MIKEVKLTNQDELDGADRDDQGVAVLALHWMPIPRLFLFWLPVQRRFCPGDAQNFHCEDQQLWALPTSPVTC